MASNVNPDPFTTRPEIEGTFGVVATTHWIATAVGMAILEKGGNAFDAGVATAFTLQVVEPHLNGPGGDVPIIVHDTKRGRTEVICGQGPAPAKATIAHYKSEGLEMVPGTGAVLTAWQATPSIRRGASRRQRSNASGQRGLKAQPGGGSIGFGISPLTGMRCRPDIARSGTAPSSILV